MKALKALVIGMGLLILLGLAVVIATLVSRVGEDGGSAVTGSPAAAGPLRLGLPQGCRVVDVTAVGEHVVLRLSGPVKDGCGELLVLEPVSGTTVRRIVPHAPAGGEEEAAPSTRQ